MLYTTTCAISYKGDRVRKGVVLDLTAEEAANLGSDVVLVEAPAPEPEAEPEKALEDMTSSELKELASSLGLSASGTKADLYERIKLHREGANDEVISE